MPTQKLNCLLKGHSLPILQKSNSILKRHSLPGTTNVKVELFVIVQQSNSKLKRLCKIAAFCSINVLRMQEGEKIKHK